MQHLQAMPNPLNLRASEYVQRALRRAGFKRSHTNKSGSRYYEKTGPDGRIHRIRVSDHELPETEARVQSREAGYQFANEEIVLDRVKSLPNVKRSMARAGVLDDKAIAVNSWSEVKSAQISKHENQIAQKVEQTRLQNMAADATRDSIEKEILRRESLLTPAEKEAYLEYKRIAREGHSRPARRRAKAKAHNILFGEKNFTDDGEILMDRNSEPEQGPERVPVESGQTAIGQKEMRSGFYVHKDSPQGALRDLAERWQDEPAGQRGVIFHEVSAEEAKAYHKVGAPVQPGAIQVVKHDDVRHAMKQHGDSLLEDGRGQLPLVPSDFTKIPDVAKPENVHAVVVRKDKTLGIIYQKLVNGHVLLVEVTGRKGQQLHLKTMRKKETEWSSRSVLSSSDTSQVLYARSETGKSTPPSEPNNPDGETLFDREPAGKPPQTGTPEFKRWFGNSKVVDAAGKPLVVYHGTTKQFEEFSETFQGETTRATSSKNGFFFASTPRTSQSYADHGALNSPVEALIDRANAASDRGDWDTYETLIVQAEQLEASMNAPGGRARGQNIIPVYLSMKNPLMLDAKGETPSGIGGIDALIQRAKAANHDGVIIKNFDDAAGLSDELADHYIVFTPTQIKSAIGNRGTFDPDDPNILMDRDDRVTRTGGAAKPRLATTTYGLAKQYNRALQSGNVPVAKAAFERLQKQGVQVQDSQPISQVELRRLLEESEMPPKAVQERPEEGFLATELNPHGHPHHPRPIS